jgi:hypothetical protein
MITKVKKIINYIVDYKNFRALSGCSKRFSMHWGDRYPCLYDNIDTTPFDTHYIYHPAWAARVISKIKPTVHIDISSTLHFCSILSAFVPVKFYDFRPAELRLSDLFSGAANIVSLPFPSNSIESLSCMHTVEHIGLGRYGDPLDPDGDLRAIAELKRVLAIGGSLLFVVPIGSTPKIMYNAHRIYSYKQITEYFKDLELKEFALIPDYPSPNGLIIDATEEMANKCTYGCGCFWFLKNQLYG